MKFVEKQDWLNQGRKGENILYWGKKSEGKIIAEKNKNELQC